MIAAILSMPKARTLLALAVLAGCAKSQPAPVAVDADGAAVDLPAVVSPADAVTPADAPSETTGAK